jgi:hypothetical protein
MTANQTGPNIHLLHCIPAEDLLLQRKHIGSWRGDKAYSTLEKLYTTLESIVHYFPGVKKALSPCQFPIYSFFEAIDLLGDYSEELPCPLLPF